MQENNDFKIQYGIIRAKQDELQQLMKKRDSLWFRLFVRQVNRLVLDAQILRLQLEIKAKQDYMNLFETEVATG